MHPNHTTHAELIRRSADPMPRRWWKVIPVLSAAVVFVVLVPALEINASHLVNPDWPAHARLHEAWQLLTNAAVCSAALWLAVIGRQRLGAGLALLVVVSLLSAYALRALYGGSIERNGGEDSVFSSGGAPVVVMLLLAASLIAVLGVRGQGARR